MLTVAAFRTRFPEFCDKTEFPDERIELFIGDSLLYMGASEAYWGGATNYDMAQAYISAHLLSLATKTELGDTRSSGPVTSKSAGGVSVSLAPLNTSNLNSTELELMSTSYGQRFITIRDKSFVGILVAVL